MGGLWKEDKVKEDIIRVSLWYLSSERSVILLDIDFDAENQDVIISTEKKIEKLMQERNIDLAKAKELICGGRIDIVTAAFNIASAARKTVDNTLEIWLIVSS